ncbi:MAG: hypothetical protein ACQERZ_08070 [Fusobacteriota bacterium]
MKKGLTLSIFLIGLFMLVGCSGAEVKETDTKQELKVESGKEYYVYNSDGSDPDIIFERWDIWGNEWTPSTCEVEEVKEDGLVATKITTTGAGWFGYAAAGKPKDFSKFSKLKVKVKTEMPELTIIFQGRGGENKIKVDISELIELDNGWKQMEIEVPEEDKGTTIAFLGEKTSKGTTVIFTDMILVGK